MTSPGRAALILSLAARAGIGYTTEEDFFKLLREQHANAERFLAEPPTIDELLAELNGTPRTKAETSSESVRANGLRKRPGPSDRACAGCGWAIVGRQSSARYCSNACACRAWRARRGLTGFPIWPWLTGRGRLWWARRHAEWVEATANETKPRNETNPRRDVQ